MRPLKIIDDHEVCDEQLRAANDRADKAEAELDRAYERYEQAEKDRNHWYDKAREYRQQSAEYRESRDKWCEVAVGERLSSRDALPRVITADEIKVWQEIAVKGRPYVNDYVFMVGTVTAIKDGYVYADDGEKEEHWERSDENSTWFLLADAPDTKDINGAKENVEVDYPDNPWFGTVYEDGAYWAETWRGTPIRPTEIRKGDVYDIHTAHGSTITGLRSARNGVYNHHDGDQYRLVHRP